MMNWFSDDSSGPVINDPVVHLTMDNADISGSSQTDHGSQGGTWTAYKTGTPSGVTGIIAQGQPMNVGSDYYYRFSNAINPNYANGTIAYWCRPATAYNSGLRTFTWASDGEAFHCQQYSDGNFYIASDNTPRLIFAMDSTNWPLNTWVHHCYTWGSVGGKKFYVNGSCIITQSLGTTVSDTPFHCGSKEGTPGIDNLFPFLGDMDEFRIYNRELSATAVSSLYSLR